MASFITLASNVGINNRLSCYSCYVLSPNTLEQTSSSQGRLPIFLHLCFLVVFLW